MSKFAPSQMTLFRKFTRQFGKFTNSRFAGWITNIPPFSWMIHFISYRWARKKLGGSNPVSPSVSSAYSNLQSSLDGIVQDIVEALGYAGAMVATYEQGDVLPVRAFYVDPKIATVEQIKEWENEISFYGHPISLSNPDIARVYLHRKGYEDNLSARAERAGGPVRSDKLFDLFTPIVPNTGREIVNGIQEAINVQEVIALPFFLDSGSIDSKNKEYVGNLFVAKCSKITDQDIRILTAFTHQASAAVLSERRCMLADSIQRLVLDMQSKMASEDQIIEQRKPPREDKKLEQRNPSVEEQILNRIVHGIVEDLGYPGAMVATLELDDVLPVRAVYVNPQLASMEQIKGWEKQVSQFGDPDHPISLTNPEVALVFVKREAYRENLSVKAVNARSPVTSGDLFELFTPIAPEASRAVVRGIQDALGIKQVIAVPFFLEDRLVGNLFAATQSEKFSHWEIEELRAFGHQAAVGLYNARLYQQSEARRDASIIFARMAFTASALVHSFRNHLSVIRGVLVAAQEIDNDQVRGALIKKRGEKMLSHLDQITEILTSLHKPFVDVRPSLVMVNACLDEAIEKVSRDLDTQALLIRKSSSVPTIEYMHPDLYPVQVYENKALDLPCVSTSPEMMTEAFRVLIKNAVEAMIEKERDAETRGRSKLWIESCLTPERRIEVKVRDNGAGIKPENLAKVFDMRWTTKSKGLGFGLFWTKDYIEAQLKGELLAESVMNEGTTFRILLPISDDLVG